MTGRPAPSRAIALLLLAYVGAVAIPATVPGAAHADPTGCGAVDLGPYGGRSLCLSGTGYHRVHLRCPAMFLGGTDDAWGRWEPVGVASASDCPAKDSGFSRPTAVSVDTLPAGPVVVPNAIGEDWQQAHTRFGAGGLDTIWQPSYVGCPPSTREIVYGQSVPAGARAEVGSTVTLSLACRPS